MKFGDIIVDAVQQKILRYWTKYASFCASFSLPTLWTGCLKTPWGNGSQRWV